MPKAKNLKYCRQKANMTQQKLADAIGVSKATVIAWESKKTAISVPNARKIADYFGIEYAEFCDIDLERIDLELEHGNVRLTDAEIQSVLMFRQLPNHVKKLIRHSIVVMYENYAGKDE